MDRVVTLTGLYKRKRFQDKETGNKFVNDLVARMEFRPVTEEVYEKRSIPMVNKARAPGARRRSARLRPRWGAGRFTEVVDRVKKGLDEVERVTAEAAKNIELFRPFIFENQYILRADNARALFDRLPPEDQKLVPWGPQHLDWFDYWMNIHFPGLQKWVLPELDQTYAPKPKQVYSYHDLLELFDTTTKLHATRTALRIERGKREEIYSYADLQELASRIGVFLLGRGGRRPAARVMLVAKNGPEWSMAFFGVLKAGAVAVPVGPRVDRRRDRQRRARLGRRRHPHRRRPARQARAASQARLDEAGLATKVWPFSRPSSCPTSPSSGSACRCCARSTTPTRSRR